MEYQTIAKRTIGHLYSAHQSIRNSGLAPDITALVELYVSQLNGCAYCCSFHANELREMGISSKLIDQLPGFRHSNSFSDKQVISLEWAEAISNNIHSAELEKLKEKLFNYFNEREIVELTASISLMNTLNRLRIVLGDKS